MMQQIFAKKPHVKRAYLTVRGGGRERVGSLALFLALFFALSLPSLSPSSPSVHSLPLLPPFPLSLSSLSPSQNVPNNMSKEAFWTKFAQHEVGKVVSRMCGGGTCMLKGCGNGWW